MAKVEFDYRPQGDKPKVPSMTGSVLYDTDHLWVIRGYDIQWQLPPGKGPLVHTVVSQTYQLTNDGFPIVKRIYRTDKVPETSMEREAKIEFELEEADVPASDFTLSAFGFPEPVGLGKPPTPWYIWAAVAAVVCLGLAVLFRWLARRRRAA